MTASIRLKLNSSGTRQAALTSPEVRAAVAVVAEAIADSARGRTDDPVTVTHAGRSRARSYVRRLGSGAAGEADDRALGSSL